MKKISIEITADSVSIIRDELKFAIDSIKPTGRTELPTISICRDLEDLFSKRETLLKDKFPSGKKRFKVNLKYHEAHVLELFLRNAYERSTNTYNKILIALAVDQINQKLA